MYLKVCIFVSVNFLHMLLINKNKADIADLIISALQL